MKFVNFINKLDKRWIYLLIALVVIIPFVFPVGCPMKITPPVQSIYNYIEDSIPENGVLLLGVDYDPSTMAELHPMAKALTYHAFYNNVRVLFVTMFPQGSGMGQDIINRTLEHWNSINPDMPKELGKDITLLAYVPGFSAVILKMGENIPATFNEDAYGNKLDNLSVMEGIKTYDDIDYMVEFSGSSVVLSWLIYANGRYNLKMGIGTTAVSAAEYYNYLQSGQANGLLGGLKGAAEYEKLLTDKHDFSGRNDASVGMDAQSAAHILFILLIILGNITFFIKKHQEGK
ncbi:MAG: hypothetical protein COX48_00835 [bacterium (Candidatus Stahlbacteria) CG23_combo_of_CG06-09_8_20_14_all_34_7]|nr:MAG: hypothetical protein COX48_00835 [bacterium (Candidatus Stahlbacteria) CG23_combo_of_CG06-09_8_20_14_all_34_7]